jgi:hypothetical protein
MGVHFIFVEFLLRVVNYNLVCIMPYQYLYDEPFFLEINSSILAFCKVGVMLD